MLFHSIKRVILEDVIPEIMLTEARSVKDLWCLPQSFELDVMAFCDVWLTAALHNKQRHNIRLNIAWNVETALYNRSRFMSMPSESWNCGTMVSKPRSSPAAPMLLKPCCTKPWAPSAGDHVQIALLDGISFSIPPCTIINALGRFTMPETVKPCCTKPEVLRKHCKALHAMIRHDQTLHIRVTKYRAWNAGLTWNEVWDVENTRKKTERKNHTDCTKAQNAEFP